MNQTEPSTLEKNKTIGSNEDFIRSIKQDKSSRLQDQLIDLRNMKMKKNISDRVLTRFHKENQIALRRSKSSQEVE